MEGRVCFDVRYGGIILKVMLWAELMGAGRVLVGHFATCWRCGGGPAKKSDTRYADVYARIIIDTRCCLFERPPCYYQSLHE